MKPLNAYEIQALNESFNKGNVAAPVGSLFMDTDSGEHVLVLHYANFEEDKTMIVYQDLVHGNAHVISVSDFLISGRFFPIGHIWDRSEV